MAWALVVAAEGWGALEVLGLSPKDLPCVALPCGVPGCAENAQWHKALKTADPPTKSHKKDSCQRFTNKRERLFFPQSC
jgi:hypothetical protein